MKNSLVKNRIGRLSSALYILIILAILVGSPQSSDAGILKTAGKIGKIVTYPAWKLGDWVFHDAVYQGIYKGEIYTEVLKPFWQSAYERGLELERQENQGSLTSVKVHFSTDGKRYRSYYKTHGRKVNFCLLVDGVKSSYKIVNPRFRWIGSTKWHKATIGRQRFGASRRLKSNIKLSNVYGESIYQATVEVWDVNTNIIIEKVTGILTVKRLRTGQR